MAKHSDLVGTALHPPAEISDEDPGAVGAGKGWIDTSEGIGAWVLKIRNDADDDWVAVPGEIPRYDGRGDGTLAVIGDQILINLEPVAVAFSGTVVNSEPNGVLSTFSDTDGTGVAFLSLPGTVVFHVTLTDDTAITIMDDGYGNLENETYDVTGVVSYSTGAWTLTFNDLVPKDTTDITVDGEAVDDSAPVAVVTAADIIKSIHGGSGYFSYTIEDMGNGLGPTSNDDPKLASITYTCTHTGGFSEVLINVYDYVLGYTAYGKGLVTTMDLASYCGI